MTSIVSTEGRLVGHALCARTSHLAGKSFPPHEIEGRPSPPLAGQSFLPRRSPWCELRFRTKELQSPARITWQKGAFKIHRTTGRAMGEPGGFIGSHPQGSLFASSPQGGMTVGASAASRPFSKPFGPGLAWAGTFWHLPFGNPARQWLNQAYCCIKLLPRSGLGVSD